MRTDLTAAFEAELSRIGRSPIQFLVFHFSSGDVWISDREVTFDGHVCLPIVESWGTMDDTVDVSKYVSNDTASSRQVSITLLNMGLTPFSNYFRTDLPENVDVTLYQGFEDLADSEAVIMDKFVIQDPIAFSEASSLLKLDMVSKNLYANPIVGGVSDEGKVLGIIVGIVDGIPGTQKGVHPKATLVDTITSSPGTITVNEDIAAVGFSTPSGTLVLNYEKITYTGVSGSSFTGCSRGVDAGATWSSAFPHRDGTEIFQYGHEYIYEFEGGPVNSIDEVYIDGNIYTGDYTLYPSTNPITIGFDNSPPFRRSSGTERISEDITANGSLGSYSGYIVGTPSENSLLTDCLVTGFRTRYEVGMSGITEIAKFEWQYSLAQSKEDHAELNNGFMSVTGWCTTPGSAPAEMSRIYVQDFPGGVKIVITGSNAPAQYEENDKPVYYSSWDKMLGLKEITFQYHTSTTSDTTADAAGVRCLKAEITYTPYVKDYSTEITADMTSDSSMLNPADAITEVLALIGVDSSIDATSFAIAESWYSTNGYSFNGFIQGDMRTREVLIAMLQMCRSRLIYNAGVIKLVVRDHLAEGTLEKVFTINNVVQKSLSIIRENVNSIVNKLTVRYDVRSVNEEYQNQIPVSDATSIADFGTQEAVFDLFLVANETMAQSIADFFLAELKDPHSFIKFQAPLHAFPLEREDDIMIFTPFNQMTSGAWCRVAFANRAFGSGKIGKMSLFDITVYTTDAFMDAGTVIELDEEIVLADDTDLDVHADSCTPDGYGSCGYGEKPYGD